MRGEPFTRTLSNNLPGRIAGYTRAVALMRLQAMCLGVMLAGATSPALAQDRQFGVKAGVNVAATTFSGDDPTDEYDERRPGWTAGAFGVLPLTTHVAVQIEALFSQKGSQVRVDAADARATLELDYLDFPVLARVSGPQSGRTRFHAFAGPSVAFRLAARRRLARTGESFSSGFVDNIEREVERFDFGVVAGAGADSGRRLVVDVRYSWGLTNLIDDAPSGVAIKNRVLALMAGVRF